MITKKNYFPAVCILFTCISLIKIIYENLILKMQDSYYASNFISIFILCAVVIALFAVAPKLSGLPLWAVLIIGYVSIVCILMLYVWIEHFYIVQGIYAYRDMFRSFTIFYIPVAVIYYIKMFRDVKRANEDLNKIQSLIERDVL